MTPTLADLTVPAPAESTKDWNNEGVVILHDAVLGSTMRDYENEWIAESPGPKGWPYAIPYMHHPALRTLVCDVYVASVLEALLGEPAACHLTLTGWRSTTRDWHQDSYLNPAHVGDAYAAVWFALDDIHPDSGPFQYIPGSHRWDCQVTQEQIGQYLDLEDPHWPTYSEDILTPLFTEEIERRDAEVITYLPKRGDVLIWHPRLLHRGSKPNDPDMERRALIAHYSGIHTRHDFANPPVQHPAGGWYYPIDSDTPV